MAYPAEDLEVIIGYAVDVVVDTVDYALGRSTSTKHTLEHIRFAEFVPIVLRRARVTMRTLLVTLAYVQRAKHHLHINSEQPDWILERVFLGALISASKYLNNSTLENVQWARCTGVFSKPDIDLIELEFLDVLDFELYVTEADILNQRQGLMAVARLPPTPRHSPRSVTMRPPHQSQEPAPTDIYVERRHAHPSHRRRRSEPQDVPELHPRSSVSLSESSSVGPLTPDSMNAWGDARVRDNPNIYGRPTYHDQPSILTMVPTLISQPVADHITKVLDNIRADTLSIAFWEEPIDPAPNIAHLLDFSEILEVWKELDLLIQRPTELMSIWGRVEDYEKFIHELRLSVSAPTVDIVNDFRRRLSEFVRDFKTNVKAGDSAPVAPNSSLVPPTASASFFKGIEKVGISGGHFVMNVSQPIVPKSESPYYSQFESYLKEIRNFTYFRTFIELAILF